MSLLSACPGGTLLEPPVEIIKPPETLALEQALLIVSHAAIANCPAQQ